jgi:hypothetical protein
MARRPAWNSKAERARRAELRAKTLDDVAAFGEAVDELVPLLSSWVQLQRQLEQHVRLFGRPFQPSANYEGPDELVVGARECSFVAGAYAYAGMRSTELARLFSDRAMLAATLSGGRLNQQRPYTAEQLAAMGSPFAEAD